MKIINIKEAISLLLNEQAIIFPTDTVYGLGTLPKKELIENLYKLKKRDKNKKIIALVSDIKYIEKIAKNINYNLINKFLPGAVSIIFETNDEYKEMLGDSIGIRIPNSKIALDLINNVGGIVMTTSANISGEKAVVNINDISKELLENVSGILITKEKLSGTPSTVISYINGECRLLREGSIKFEEILKWR